MSLTQLCTKSAVSYSQSFFFANLKPYSKKGFNPFIRGLGGGVWWKKTRGWKSLVRFPLMEMYWLTLGRGHGEEYCLTPGRCHGEDMVLFFIWPWAGHGEDNGIVLHLTLGRSHGEDNIFVLNEDVLLDPRQVSWWRCVGATATLMDATRVPGLFYIYIFDFVS
jgi:hypothetical protein